MLFDVMKGGRTTKILAIGMYHIFCDYIDYVFAYILQSQEINYDIM